MAAAMMRGLVATLEQHHKVRILDEAVSEAVRLSARYIPARQLPDKARQPARHRLRPRGDEPERHAGADRGPPAPHRR